MNTVFHQLFLIKHILELYPIRYILSIYPKGYNLKIYPIRYVEWSESRSDPGRLLPHGHPRSGCTIWNHGMGQEPCGRPGGGHGQRRRGTIKTFACMVEAGAGDGEGVGS